MHASQARTIEDRLGSTIAQRYELRRVLGMGGSGALYAACHVRTGREIAIKLLHADVDDAYVARLRLLREAAAAADLRHPHVVDVLDLGEAEDGTSYLAMELLRGRSLQEVLEQDGPVDVARLLEWIFPILGALAIAHDRGVLHRDIKPANVFLAEDPRLRTVPKLLDFGIAKIEGSAALTQPGKVIGTADFMSPEQMQGAELTKASDLWSVAALLFVCCSGRVPFGPEAMAEPRTPALPADSLASPEALSLLPVIERALEWNPSARFADARSFSRALLAAAHRASIPVPDDPEPLGLPEYRAWHALLERDPVTLARTHSARTYSAAALEQAVSDATGVHPAPLPRVGDTLAARFVLKAAIGRGAVGAVFEAEDTSTKERVALKVLHRLEPSAIYRLKREFRALAEVSHPNLVALHELFVDEQRRWFFTMDLVRGCTFVNHVRSDTGDGYDEARLRKSLVQLARGVQHLHAAGKLHRDLKPSNVLVTKESRLSIVDFGLAHPFREIEGAHMEHEFLGTPGYAAPERIDPRRTGPASDWYAVGVMLYEALTGKPPFEGNSHQVMLEKNRRDPVPPSARAANVPKDLERLCMHLLARDPDLRGEGRDLLALLDAPAASLESERRVSFAGRERELALLREAFEEARQGRAQACFVRAPSGMGKTTLCEHFLRELLEARKALVLRGRCYAQEALHYKAFDGVVDALSSYLRQLSSETAASLLPADCAALAQLFPVLRRVELIARASRPSAPPEDPRLRRRAFLALEELFEKLSARTPVVVFVDDLQWGDVDSARLLRELLAGSPDARIFWLGAYRSEAETSAPMLQEILREGGPAPRHLDLGPLPLDSVAMLAQHALPPSIAPTAVSEIARSSQGHPMLAVELIRFARERGGLGTLTRVSLPEAIGAALARLSAEAHAILRVCSLAGQRLPRVLVFEVARCAAPLSALRELRLSNAVRETVLGEELHLEPYHDQVREVVVAGLSAADETDLHSRLADAMLARGDAFLEAAVYHFVQSGRRSEVSVLAERAARHASEALAFDRAAALLEVALAHAGQADTQRLRIALADESVRAGRTLEAARTYDCAAAQAGGEERFELARRAMTQYFVAGHCERGNALFRELAKGVGLQVAIAPTPWWKQLFWLLRLSFMGRPRLLPAGDARGDEEPDTRLLRTRLRLLWSAAPPLVHVESTLAASFARHAVQMAARLGEAAVYSQALAFYLLAAPYVFGTAWRSVRRRLEHATQLAEAHGGIWDRAFVQVMRGCHCLFVVDLNGTLERCLPWATSTEPRTDLGAAVQSCARAAVLPTLYWRGQLERLAELAESWIEEARQNGNRHLEVNFRILGAHRFLRHDDPGRAHAEIERARAVALDYLHPALCDPWWEASLLLYEDRAEEALERCLGMKENFEAHSGGSDSSRALWALTVGTAAARVIAENGQGVARARKLLGECVRAVRRTRGALQKPVSRQLAGTLAALQGHRAQAFELLELAGAGYAALGFRLHAASVRYELARLGHPDGETLRHAACLVFETEGVRRPDRWARMLAPGIAP